MKRTSHRLAHTIMQDNVTKDGDTPSAPSDDGDQPNASHYLNRHLSWLQFNRRVLAEATRRRHPLLERAKFLAIFSTNLDEFFMVHVSTLREQRDAGSGDRSPDGLTPAEQLERIKPVVIELAAEQH